MYEREDGIDFVEWVTQQPWFDGFLLHLVGFAATTTIALHLILDLEYPRLGLVRVDDFDQAMLDLRESMH